jgi:hypothetical protein
MSTVERNYRFKWIRLPNKERLYHVGILTDGSLYNPNGYPEDLVRTSVITAIERRAQRRKEGAQRAAKTRQERLNGRLYETVKRLKLGHRFGPRQRCYVCTKALIDSESIERGIGPECWQGVLRRIHGDGE